MKALNENKTQSKIFHFFIKSIKNDVSSFVDPVRVRQHFDNFFCFVLLERKVEVISQSVRNFKLNYVFFSFRKLFVPSNEVNLIKLV